jgi:hypothetical protein
MEVFHPIVLLIKVFKTFVPEMLPDILQTLSSVEL